MKKSRPVTINDLKDKHLASIHCGTCGHCRVIDPATLPVPPDTAIPDLAGRFRCSRCNSKESTVMPYYDTQQKYGGAGSVDYGTPEGHTVAA